MIAQLRAELLKQRSTYTSLGLFVGMIALVLLALLLHALALPADRLRRADAQLSVLGRGEQLGVLFAALAGAVSVTSEFRHGTIRPTLVAMPRRGRVLAAKLMASLLVGGTFGLVACAMAAAIGAATLGARGIHLQLSAGAVALLVIGGAFAGALWAAIGVGVGAVVRHQVATLIGICAWLLFVEGLLVGDVASVTSIGRFAPGAAAAALTGQHPTLLLAPALALILLAAYAGIAGLAGGLTLARRDVG